MSQTPKPPARPPSTPARPPSTPAKPSSPSASAASVPREVAEPQPNPLKDPPPPDLPRRKPGRPRKEEARPATPAPTAGPPPQPEKRQLPTDAGELDRALAPYRVQWLPVTDLLNQLVSVLPPRLPLQKAERDGFTEAGARVLYVHGGELDPGWFLFLSLVAIATTRYALYRAGVKELTPEQTTAVAKASEQTIALQPTG